MSGRRGGFLTGNARCGGLLARIHPLANRPSTTSSPLRYALRGWNSAAVAVSAEQCLRDKGSHGQRSEAGEGCRLTGYMLVNKVAGNFHIAMGETHSRGNGHIHQFNPSQLQNFNTSHVIHSLSFGEPFPGIRNPLDGTVAIADVSTGVFMYFAKIVPTIFTPANAPHIATNQYSVTSQFRPLMVNGMRQVRACAGVGWG